VHLDRGYDYQAVRDELAARGLHARIAERGKPAPIQAGHRWVIERTHAWMNNYGKLIRCTERHKPVVEFYLALATAIVTLGRLSRSWRSAGPSGRRTAAAPKATRWTRSGPPARRSAKTARPSRAAGASGRRCGRC